MNTISPIFPFHEPQHFSDYGFDPQIDYFQVLEEARKHKRDTSSSTRSTIDNLHFKLQKPISKDDNSKKIKKTRKKWWKNALHFFKRKKTSSPDKNLNSLYGGTSVRTYSGPVYLAESRSGSVTPYHRSSTSMPSSGSLTRKGDINIDIPYFSLTEMNMDQSCKISASHVPIYLVT